MKKKSYKLAKLERERFSIITDDLSRCYICGMKKEHLHEVYPGKNRIRSIKEHMILPLCFNCHRMIHDNSKTMLYWKQYCQNIFEKNHTREEFIQIFGKSYL